MEVRLQLNHFRVTFRSRIQLQSKDFKDFPKDSLPLTHTAVASLHHQVGILDVIKLLLSQYVVQQSEDPQAEYQKGAAPFKACHTALVHASALLQKSNESSTALVDVCVPAFRLIFLILASNILHACPAFPVGILFVVLVLIVFVLLFAELLLIKKLPVDQSHGSYPGTVINFLLFFLGFLFVLLVVLNGLRVAASDIDAKSAQAPYACARTAAVRVHRPLLGFCNGSRSFPLGEVERFVLLDTRDGRHLEVLLVSELPVIVPACLVE